MSIFNEVRSQRPPTNTFDLTHEKKLSTQMGKLTPIFCSDLVPGDKFTINSNVFIRFAPLIAPVMHRINVYVHYFFVPNRILWENWEDFITGGTNGTSAPAPPTFNLDFATQGLGTIADYLGLPTSADLVGAGSNTTRRVSAFPHAAFQKIWYDYFRDQNFDNIPEVELQDGDQGALAYNSWYNLTRYRAWQHDYFTSGLPWTQRGPETMLPLAGQAPLLFWPDSNIPPLAPEQIVRDMVTGAPITPGVAQNLQVNPTFGQVQTNTGLPVGIDVTGTHTADLTGATATSIIDLRRAFKLQEYLEKTARGGGRYQENTMIIFGVKPQDGRLQRPEYLGGMSAPIKISEVLQTSETTQSAPLGNMAGHAVALGGSKNISYRAPEHGYIIGIMSVLPKADYQQGIPKHFLRRDKFDYYWPDFAHIGEQAIENNEMAIDRNDSDLGTGVWGYTPRYAEYKFMSNTVHGDFRTTLDFWHLGRKFNTFPNLTKFFIYMNPAEVNRIFAVDDPDLDSLWCQVLNQVEATRPMPYFGTPRL